MLVWDIETEPLEESRLREIYQPLDESKIKDLVTGEFDPSTVKTGNMKDASKIAEKIDAARAAHESAVARSGEIISEAKANHWAEFVASSTLSAVTSKVLCIGYHSPQKGKSQIHGDVSERQIIETFWKQFASCQTEGRSMIGVNIHNFDLPYMVRRSWMLGIDVPDDAMEMGRYWNRTFVDLSQVWLAGQRFGSEPANFETLAKAFGTAGKNGENGADFWKLWRSDRERAVAYLLSDIEQPAIWAQRMGIMQ